MAPSRRLSAGLLLFRRASGGGPHRLEVLLAHPGGPFWARRDEGVWSLPKGEAESGDGDGGTAEDLARVAAREFSEETGHPAPGPPWLDLGEVVQKAGKRIHAFAAEADLDAARCRSNEIEIEWPPRSGHRLRVPEVDRVAWFPPEEARRRLNPAQAAFVDRLEALLA